MSSDRKLDYAISYKNLLGPERIGFCNRYLSLCNSYRIQLCGENNVSLEGIGMDSSSACKEFFNEVSRLSKEQQKIAFVYFFELQFFENKDQNGFYLSSIQKLMPFIKSDEYFVQRVIRVLSSDDELSLSYLSEYVCLRAKYVSESMSFYESGVEGDTFPNYVACFWQKILSDEQLITGNNMNSFLERMPGFDPLFFVNTFENYV